MLKTLKTVQAIGVLGRAFGTDRLNYMRTLKLLYIADRESLGEIGRTITGDKMVAMDRGPVLSNVLDLINGKHVDVDVWDRFLKTEGYHIHLHGEPGVGQLSRYEISKLQNVALRHVLDDEWAMVKHTHEFDEWKKNYVEGTSRPIPIADILTAVQSAVDLESVSTNDAAERAFDRVFGS